MKTCSRFYQSRYSDETTNFTGHRTERSSVNSTDLSRGKRMGSNRQLKVLVDKQTSTFHDFSEGVRDLILNKYERES